MNKYSIYLLATVFMLANMYLTYKGEYVLNAVPIALLLVYTALYHFDKLFYFIVLFTPLSVNIEEFVGGDIGLFVPTEPLLFGMLLLIGFNQVRKNQFETAFLKHPITIIFIIQLCWILLTTITSEMPLVSLKFFLTKLWFIVPIYFYGYYFFKQEKRIEWFIGLFIASMSVVAMYTLVNHAANGFDEETGHWVMWPFFKDHTSYGAILALVYPLFFGIFYIKKDQPLIRLLMIFLILLFGFAIIMSYTRAAWMSLFGALIVYMLIKFKVNFKYLAMLGVGVIIYIAANWTSINHALEKNRSEHATEDMNERLESMANVTTDASNLERLNRWGSAIRMWQERPVLGWGPGTYAMVYAPFQLSSGMSIISTNSGDRGNAHSEYLGPLSEQGLPGMLLMILLVIYICYTAIALYIRMPDGDMKVLLMCVFLGLVTYFSHGILNNYLDTDKATVPVWGFTAFIVMLDLKYPRKPKTS
ncbi:O-antigen ligase family protein [Paracrocinitomix mangrovi]|uniref:O-antigen ligase family protein n=1 Tax=Paracrocinitomix mangrovi TaxID=2862509 RepID=UPI001EDBBBFF|nr:O-antigen ligase family protein [Paracrocinitomix mangrovi]UKN02928.1 O-antigen ligase family protein [Paracrocinitomix mangrovi]